MTRVPTCQVCPDRPPLRLSQPSDSDYIRLIAVCPACSRWYYREAIPGKRSTTTLLPVPTLEDLRGRYGVELEPPPRQPAPADVAAAALALLAPAG